MDYCRRHLRIISSSVSASAHLQSPSQLLASLRISSRQYPHQSVANLRSISWPVSVSFYGKSHYYHNYDQSLYNLITSLRIFFCGKYQCHLVTSFRIILWPGSMSSHQHAVAIIIIFWPVTVSSHHSPVSESSHHQYHSSYTLYHHPTCLIIIIIP